MKAVFVLGTLELDAVKLGLPMLPETLKFFESLSSTFEFDDISIVYAVEDPYFAGKDKQKIKMERILEGRPRVLSEINSFNPDFVMCFGPVAAASIFAKGNLTEEVLLRARHNPLGEMPVYYTYSLENLRVFPGLEEWIKLDIYAATNGFTKTVWGQYLVASPGENIATFNAPVMAVDAETYPGLDYWHPNARLRMVQVSEEEGCAVIQQCSADSSIPAYLKKILEDPSILKVGSNIKFDYCWLRRFGITMRNFEDTSTREHILDVTNPLKDLKSLTFKYLPRLGDYSRPHRALIKARRGWENIKDEEFYQYAGADAEASIAAWKGQVEGLKKFAIPRQIMKDLYEALSEIEYSGVCIDLDENSALDERYADFLQNLGVDIERILGPVNLNSPLKLAKVLKEKVPGIDLSVGGIRRALSEAGEEEEIIDESTSKKILRRESHKHPVVEKVLRFRQYRTRHSTFIQKLKERLSLHHGASFLHTQFRTDRVETMRLAASKPNLLNIPRLDRDNPELTVKTQFTSRWKDGLILEVDLSQIELRFAAWASGDPAMKEVLESGEDIHTGMASKCFNKPIDTITEGERQRAKDLSFLILYGGGASNLAERIGVSVGTAKKLIKDFFLAFPRLQQYIFEVHKEVKQTLEVTTHFGFRRRFRKPYNWRSTDGFHVLRQAFNTYIQNGAVILGFLGIIAMQNALKARNLRSLIVLTVHDSVVFDVYPGELEEVKKLAKYGMEIANVELAKTYGVNFDVPVKANIKAGPNWGQLEEIS